MRPKRTTELEVVLYYGETGTGKTRTWHDKYVGSEEFYRVPVGRDVWFDGYDMHKYVLLDDFSGAASHMSLATLLQILDRYPLQVPVKGSFVWWMPDKICITTNIRPIHWYKWEGRESQYQALKRRIHKVLDFDKKDAEGNALDATDSFWDIDDVPFDTNVYECNY